MLSLMVQPGTRFRRVVKDVEAVVVEEPVDDPRALALKVIDAVRAGNLKLPMLPETATRALAAAGDPSLGTRDLERIVAGDPMVAARVMTVANSARYGGVKSKSLGMALGRLGSGTLRDVLYQVVAECHIFRGPSGDMLCSERDHGVMVGRLAKRLCQEVGIDGEYAFLCGLLHDLGRPFLAGVLERDGDALSSQQKESLVRAVHGRIGAELAKRWNLPGLVVEACRRHHNYEDGPAGPYSQIGNIVAAADRLATHHGCGRPPRRVPRGGDACFFHLGLRQEVIGPLLVDTSSLPAD